MTSGELKSNIDNLGWHWNKWGDAAAKREASRSLRLELAVAGESWLGPAPVATQYPLNGARDEYGIPDELARLQKPVSYTTINVPCC